jgi:hypothetical protein
MPLLGARYSESHHSLEIRSPIVSFRSCGKLIRFDLRQSDSGL